jgi:hypothetical protein
VHIEGDLYDGEWKYDKANGFGTYNHINGAIYCVIHILQNLIIIL